MQQAFHIFRKDARQFRFEIGGLLAVLAVMALAGAEPWSNVERTDAEPAQVFSALAAFFAWFLVGRVMHSEALPGDRHFWLTRPYSRTSLMVAKALFIAAFVNLPLLIAQTAILAADGLLADGISGLLWNQVLVTVVAILPAAALASMTRNMVQYGLASIVAAALGAISVDAPDRMGAFEWVRFSVGVAGLAAVAVPVMAIQFLRRKRLKAVALAASGSLFVLVLYIIVPLKVALGVQTAARQPVQGFDVQVGAPLPVDPEQRVPWGMARIPYRISGLEGGKFRVDAVQVTLVAPSGAEWKPRLLLPYAQRIEYTPEGIQHRFYTDGGFLHSWGQSPVRFRAAFYVTAFGEDQVTQVALDGSPAHIPGLGQCGNLPIWGRFEFVCRAPFRLPHGIAAYNPTAGEASATYQPERSYSPFPADISILPVVMRRDFSTQDETTGERIPFAGSQAAITVREPIAHFRYELEVPGFRLADYVARRPLDEE